MEFTVSNHKGHIGNGLISEVPSDAYVSGKGHGEVDAICSVLGRYVVDVGDDTYCEQLVIPGICVVLGRRIGDVYPANVRNSWLTSIGICIRS